MAAPQEEHWMQKLWRPSMGWTYMAINVFDFILAPAFVLYLRMKGVQVDMWKSLTLDNGGFIHLAFGAILGVSAYGRSQEKTKSLEMNGNNIDANIANNTVADDKK
jgi:hypothetical protein